MVIIKTLEQINGIRKSSQLASKVLSETSKLIKAGITTNDLNIFAHNLIINSGAIPAPLHYNGFPKSICTSVNNVVCHGIPSDTPLQDGDIINIDITTILNNYYGDVSATFPVGKIDTKTQQFIDIVKKSLDLSIEELKPGKYLNQCVGAIIEPFVKKYGYSVVKELGGHGVGIKFHEAPFVFHFENRDKDILLKPGMIFTIEPMINNSLDWRITLDARDGWTIRTKDGSLSCQFEHTVLITPTSHEVLTTI